MILGVRSYRLSLELGGDLDLPLELHSLMRIKDISFNTPRSLGGNVDSTTGLDLLLLRSAGCFISPAYSGSHVLR